MCKGRWFALFFLALVIAYPMGKLHAQTSLPIPGFHLTLPFSFDLRNGADGHELRFAGLDTTGTDYSCRRKSFELSDSLGLSKIGSLSCEFQEWIDERSIGLKWETRSLLGAEGTCSLAVCANESCESSTFNANLVLTAPLKSLLPADLATRIPALICDFPIGLDLDWQSSNNELGIGVVLGGFTF